MASINFISSLLCSILYSTLIISTSSSTPITLKLTPNLKPISSQNLNGFISNIAKSALNRAYHIKYLNKNPSKPASTPLFPISEGGYSIYLSIGTPPQKIAAFFDTGSSLVWVPCTSRYSCLNCTQDNTKITTFLPKKSSSKHSVKCNNKKCHWLEDQASCPKCSRAFLGSCTKPCSYTQAYVAGETSGNAIFESLNFGTKVVPDFFVGCSLKSEFISDGNAGFGRNPMSLPNQLMLSKFSHCFLTHKFDDSLKSSSLILGDSGSIPGVKYTPFLKNPPNFPFNQYYYIHLEQITVGAKIVKIPHEISFPNTNGNGGTIVDSGSTLTSLTSNVFDPIVEHFLHEMTLNQRKQAVIAQSPMGNLLCMNVIGSERKLVLPEVVFYFKGGAKMDLTVDNYIRGSEKFLCLPFVNVTFDVDEGGNGPAIILGNYQQQNFHIEYDLKHERFGLKKQNCGARS